LKLTPNRRINHNRKGGGLWIEQPKVGPKGESEGASESEDTEANEDELFIIRCS
jgi:hypothetical protein